MLASVTTIREGSQDSRNEWIRAAIFLETAKSHEELGIPLFAVHAECSEKYLAQLRTLGVRLESQVGSGMGAVRRQALRFAANECRDADFFLWCEPEKSTFVQLIEPGLTKAIARGAAAVFFNRISLTSYPDIQAAYYAFTRSFASILLGFDLDFGFGPMVVARSLLDYFLNYAGEYGDLWDSILIPRLRIIKGGLPFAVIKINFLNDARMTAVEAQSIDIAMKRVSQLNCIVPALAGEIKRLAIQSETRPLRISVE